MRINELLNENQIHDYQHGTIDSNHAPMTLIAMHELGASDQELETYFNSIKKEWNTQKLDISRTGKLDRNNYSEFYGQRSYFSRFVDFFCLELEHNGLTKTLEVYLPELALAPASAAYHPMIRLAYGIEFNNEQECTHALAYWASVYLKSPSVVQSDVKVSPDHLVQKIINEYDFRKQEMQGGVRARIQRYMEDPEFQKHAKGIDWKLDELFEVTLRLFEETQHFTLLHGVTSFHALRVIFPYVKNKKEALDSYWVSVVVAYLTVLAVDTSKLNSSFSGNDMEWKEVFKLSIKSETEHTIKLAYTAYKQEEFYEEKFNLKKLAIREIERASPFI